ncbi:MAG: histidine kinase [Bacteroidetes bacterium]|nr:histidine kinase [Bacteroidota bacterium]
MEDYMGNFWFATSYGVNIYSPPAYQFKHYTHIPGISNSPEGYVVTAVAEDEKQNLWIGYEKDGLDYFDRKTGVFHHNLEDKNNNNSIACNNVSALYYDENNRLWVGLWRGIGFNMLDVKKKQFSLFRYNKKTLEQDWYGDFVEDKKGNFYIGFWGADGLTGFDRETKQFLNSYKDRFERTDCSRLITSLRLDSQGSIWFGTTDCGLHRYFPEIDSGVSYFSDSENTHGLSSNNVSDITIDNNGTIWFINDKLQKYIPENDSFISYGYANGLTTSELASVVADESGDIWIGAKTDGLFRFKPEELKFIHYVKQDGLLSNSFTSAGLKLYNGSLFFGCNNGFNIFNPSDIVENDEIPVPYFGRLYVYDHIVSHDLNEEERIILESDKNVFTVELLSSDIVNPGRYSYQCMLEGYDERWVDISSEQRAVRYAAVPSGTYKLKYRIGNRKDLWSVSTPDVWFKIEKPYYLTWWFITSNVVVFSVFLFLFVKQREFDLKQKNRNIELQQRLFRLQMNPHFMYNSLLAIQNFIFLHNPKEAGNYLSDFAHLFRLILNNSKSEFIPIGKEVETLNLYLKLQSLRYPDKFTYNIYIDPVIDTELVMIPPMLAQPMIENALEHGLFYKEGSGKIEISFKYSGNELLFEVEDNGIGLTKAKEKAIPKVDHKSSALEITRERIKILGKRHGFFAIFEIKELRDQNENVTGTKVRFNLPTKISMFDKLE